MCNLCVGHLHEGTNSQQHQGGEGQQQCPESDDAKPLSTLGRLFHANPNDAEGEAQCGGKDYLANGVFHYCILPTSRFPTAKVAVPGSAARMLCMGAKLLKRLAVTWIIVGGLSTVGAYINGFLWLIGAYDPVAHDGLSLQYFAATTVIIPLVYLITFRKAMKCAKS